MAIGTLAWPFGEIPIVLDTYHLQHSSFRISCHSHCPSDTFVMANRDHFRICIHVSEWVRGMVYVPKPRFHQQLAAFFDMSSQTFETRLFLERGSGKADCSRIHRSRPFWYLCCTVDHLPMRQVVRSSINFHRWAMHQVCIPYHMCISAFCTLVRVQTQT